MKIEKSMQDYLTTDEETVQSPGLDKQSLESYFNQAGTNIPTSDETVEEEPVIEWSPDEYVEEEPEAIIEKGPAVGTTESNLGVLNRKQRKYLMKKLGIKKPKARIEQKTEAEIRESVKSRRKMRKKRK